MYDRQIQSRSRLPDFESGGTVVPHKCEIPAPALLIEYLPLRYRVEQNDARSRGPQRQSAASVGTLGESAWQRNRRVKDDQSGRAAEDESVWQTGVSVFDVEGDQCSRHHFRSLYRQRKVGTRV